MTVWLVGAGPGDPGLITAKGLELIRCCDALVYDVLVSPELVEEAPDDALAILREDVRQAELSTLLVELGRQGLEVVRLKGGDPFVFGRGGEEAEALAEAGIPFEIVPGVSALSAVPASAGIPITHRGVAAQVTLVSGHSASGDDLDFAQLAAAPGTLVVFMGLGHLGEIAGGLIAAGKDAVDPRGRRLPGTSGGPVGERRAPRGGRAGRGARVARAPRRRRRGRGREPPLGAPLCQHGGVEPRRARRLVGRDPVLAVQRQSDVVEAVDEHVPREGVELERDA